MIFLWSLSDSKSLHASRTLLSILADLNNAEVLTVSTRPVISKSSSPYTNPFVTVQGASIIIGIIVTFMYHSFCQFPNKVKILFPLLHSFNFIMSGRLIEIRWSVCLEECVRVYLHGRFWIVYIPFVLIVKFQFLAQFSGVHLPFFPPALADGLYWNLSHSTSI